MIRKNIKIPIFIIIVVIFITSFFYILSIQKEKSIAIKLYLINDDNMTHNITIIFQDNEFKEIFNETYLLHAHEYKWILLGNENPGDFQITVKNENNISEKKSVIIDNAFHNILVSITNREIIIRIKLK